MTILETDRLSVYHSTSNEFTTGSPPVNPKLLSFQRFLADPPCPRSCLHADQYHQDKETGLYQYDGFNREYAQMMFFADGNPLETARAFTRALEGLYTLCFIAAGAASKTGGYNSLEDIAEQYRRLKNHEALGEGFKPWEATIRHLEPYYQQLHLLGDKMKQLTKPVEQQENTKTETVTA